MLQHIGCCMATTLTILHTAFQAFHWGGGGGGGEGLLAHISENKVRIT